MKLNANELKIIKALSADDRMTYFVNHVIDNDELWSLSDDDGWYMKTVTGNQVIQLWPYEEYVEKPSENEKKANLSLSSFMDNYLSEFIKSNMYFEIFSVKDDAGKILPAIDFKNILEEELQNHNI